MKLPVALLLLLLPALAAAQSPPGPATPASPAAGPAAKKIKSVFASETEVFNVPTAVGSNTLIQLQETIKQAFLGNPNLFAMEILDRTVAIKPREEYPSAATNLTVITASSRLTFWLTVGNPDQALLIVDVKPANSGISAKLDHNERIEARLKQLEEEYGQKRRALEATAENKARQFMLQAVAEGVAVSTSRARERKNDIILKVEQIARLGPMTLIRLKIQNKSDTTFKSGTLSAGHCEKRVFSSCGEPDPLKGIDVLLPKDPVLPGQEAIAAVGFPTPKLEGDQEILITIGEAPGGKDREVTISGVEL